MVLLKAAEYVGPFVMVARIAVSRAVHGVSGVEPPPAPRRRKRREHLLKEVARGSEGPLKRGR